MAVPAGAVGWPLVARTLLSEFTCAGQNVRGAYPLQVFVAVVQVLCARL